MEYFKKVTLGLSNRTISASQLLDELNSKRLEGAEKLSGRAEEVCKRTVSEIDNFLGDVNVGQNAERDIYHSPNFLPVGGLVRSNGRTDIIVNSSYAFFEETEGLAILRRFNPLRCVSPEDMLRLIVSHEYGHIFFDEILFPRLCSLRGYGKMLSIGPNVSESEAFAFWFGDSVAGLSSDLKMHSFDYQRRGIDFGRTIKLYRKLEELASDEGPRACFDVGNLKGIFR